MAEIRDKLYYSISEVARLAEVKAHVLRYWETEFPMLSPPKNRAGNRTYRPQDVKMVLAIKKLLYDQGYTITGARQKLHTEKGSVLGQAEIPFNEGRKKERLRALRDGLKDLLDQLDDAG